MKNNFDLKKYLTEGSLFKENNSDLQSDFEKIRDSGLFSEVSLIDGVITLSGGQERYKVNDDEWEESKKLFKSPSEVIKALKNVKGRKLKMKVSLQKFEDEEEDGYDGITEYIDYYYTLTPIQ